MICQYWSSQFNIQINPIQSICIIEPTHPIFQIDHSSTSFFSSNKLHHKYEELEPMTVRIRKVDEKYRGFNILNTKTIFSRHYFPQERPYMLKVLKSLNPSPPSSFEIHIFSKLFQ